MTGGLEGASYRLAVGASVVSLIAQVGFWNWQLVAGVLLDVAVLVLAVWGAPSGPTESAETRPHFAPAST